MYEKNIGKGGKDKKILFSQIVGTKNQIIVERWSDKS
jgi:hypothetical protein